MDGCETPKRKRLQKWVKKTHPRERRLPGQSGRSILAGLDRIGAEGGLPPGFEKRKIENVYKFRENKKAEKHPICENHSISAGEKSIEFV
ncbi:hypothetical protein [Dysosmobacter sp. Sow4_B12]|uniref:hypothetical protein n=1 Tax=Dysosmobacter sp. Sow4_B12 TaxID=3438777 RepID=UPI003F8E3D13